MWFWNADKDSICTQSDVESRQPRRVELWRSSEGPEVATFKMNVIEAERASPNEGIVEPRCNALWRGSVGPRCKESSIDANESERTSEKTAKFKPEYDKLRGSDKKPMWRESSDNDTKPSRLKLCGSMAKPSLT